MHIEMVVLFNISPVLRYIYCGFLIVMIPEFWNEPFFGGFQSMVAISLRGMAVCCGATGKQNEGKSHAR